MTFTTITIPDPAEVGAWLDKEQPDKGSPQRPTFGIYGWQVCHWTGESHIVPCGATPEELLANLRAKLAEHDPLAKAREQLESAGYAVIAPD